jgi:RNA polymerase sigma-70 factor, ECF subfamily
MFGDEANLVSEARRGDEAAFDALYGRYRAAVFGFAWRMTGSVAAAEDVAQDCFLALVRGTGFDARRGALRTYLFGVARHAVFRHLKVSGREAEELPDAPAPDDAAEELLSAERGELVRRAIANLPALQREAIVLFEYEEMTLEAIAAVTGVEVGAVKARLSRARESLRKRLEPLLAPAKERKCS